MKLGLQIYTLREYLTTPDQIRETLGKAKDMGYAGIEWFGLMGHTPAELAEMTAEAGMEMFSLHRDIGDLVKCDTEELDAIAATGVKYLPIGWLPKDRLAGGAQFAETCELIRTYGKEAAKRGMLLMYHNHDFDLELYENKPLLDHLYAAVSADVLGAELDTCWLYSGGVDPTEYIHTYADRAPIVHLKNCVKDGGRHGFKPVGSGVLDWNGILSACQRAEWVCVEQDEPSDGMDAFACAKTSAEFLKSLLAK